jgi:chlorite dismutase
MSSPTTGSAIDDRLDLREKGRKEGVTITLDRRLFMKFTAFGSCTDVDEAIVRLAEADVAGALYLDANDPQGIGVMVASEDPELYVTKLRAVFSGPPFASMRRKAELDMLGRTYSMGYEPDLEASLIAKPREKLLNAAFKWAVWYPLQRAKIFQTLPVEQQRRMLAEHGTLARRYGAAGVASDIRLACHGLDQHDNDFIVGLLGPALHPLSAIVQEMRRTEQTSQYLDRLGPFFVGRVAWQSGVGR